MITAARRRYGAAAIVAVLLAGSSTAAAQVRIHKGGGQQPSIRNQAVQQPPAPAEVRAGQRAADTPRAPTRLTTRDRLVGTPQFFFPCCFGGAFGYPWWPYDAQLQTLPLGPTLENAPVGGLQLDIEPRSAEVYVDGIYTGVVSDYSGYFKHLEIAAGPHIVTFVAPAYEPLTISVVVAPGRTLTWRTSLTRAYGR